MRMGAVGNRDAMEKSSLLEELEEEDEEESGVAGRASRPKSRLVPPGLATSSSAIAKSKRVVAETVRVVEGVAGMLARDGEVLRSVQSKLRSVDEMQAEGNAVLRSMECTRRWRVCMVPCLVVAFAGTFVALWFIIVRR